MEFIRNLLSAISNFFSRLFTRSSRYDRKTTQSEKDLPFAHATDKFSENMPKINSAIRKNFYKSLLFLEQDDSADDLLDVTAAGGVKEAPICVKRRMRKAIDDVDLYKYPDSAKLKQDATVFYRDKRGIKHCTADNIAIAPSSFDLATAVFSTYFPYANIAMITPNFGYYTELLTQQWGFRGKVDFFNTPKQSHFHISMSALRQYIEESKPSAIFLTNPNNPTGDVLTESELSDIAEICRQNDTWIICDETFASTTPHTTTPYSSIAKFADPRKCIVFNGFSKGESCANLRVSTMCAPRDVIENIRAHISGTVSNVVAEGLGAILDPDAQEKQELVDHFIDNDRIIRHKQESIHEKLDSINQKLSVLYNRSDQYIKVFKPEATSVLLLDFRSLYNRNFLGRTVKSGYDIGRTLLDITKVKVVPGEAFMIAPEDMMCRISLAYDNEKLMEVFDRIEQQVDKELQRSGKNASRNPPSYLAAR